MKNGNSELLRALPSVDLVLKEADALVEQWGHQQVSNAIRHALQHARERIQADALKAVPDARTLLETISEQLQNSNQASLRPVFNLSGTVLHTNLGRALLPRSAVDAVVRVATRASNLEYDLENGKRGDRDSHIDQLLSIICGAEAATVVNNNAAAVLLTLNTLAKDKEVLVSRGELVEIGGAFRMPEIIRSAGCVLTEIGTTNRTHLRDYASAIHDNTALLLKVHTSNYRIEGFTKEVTEKALVQLAGERQRPFVVDLGSGNLADFSALGLPEESTVQEHLEQGVDIVTFSGDKLLGGPQCGIIVGKKALVEKIKANPMKRALRSDKMTIAALHEVLRLYQNPDRLRETLPTCALLTRPVDDIETQVRRLLEDVATALAPAYMVEATPCRSQVGSGALPVETLPSFALAVRASDNRDQGLRTLAAALRRLPVPVIGRLHDGALFLDLRCLDNEEEFLAQLAELEVTTT